jgi:hypothetical protein
MKILFFALTFFFSNQILSQVKPPLEKNQQIQKEIDFETYCLLNATSLLELVQEKKSSLKLSGELDLIENGNYKSYGIVLKEGENQYFQIKGSTQILVVKSLFVLRLNYSNSKK